ncbi:MAG: phosphoribosylformylglycinamidine synthase subunit PurQ [Lentisphaerae bacterium]|jgi:phosphoribosylformylglycinamidine synthase subunit PurQ / glutaminase|nr:phosphoribosylformylglycinamidine synthase subunit PurQ [Lentisphaerota bacterium]MBT4816671.1 phosphoribosylformylglycinamidine synthase subunit PurQ [Lentisphaerota bacterium]MBT5611294.1 phosphoribosylformylglycinamidine synthase subunit PurQ [Lentisphaerota bacterium]MBT7058389.1 phosphoribosylformylglycinamidine synthase subunit PurQ [Lentisphaerota bacterium]MBT7846824.1 phosphoribosylformylglycinamidine synthase subunit PurQ [Lentisphaerota bacterium]
MNGTTANVRALVITGLGLNCEKETSCALRMAGAVPEQVHLSDILAGERSLDEFQILAFIGGFSFGDHIGAGTIFANRLKYQLREQLLDYVDSGRLVIGICNGFQTITRLGLVPALDGVRFEQQVALAQNAQGVFRDSWVMLRANPDSPCVFTQGIDLLPLPIRHGEGRFVPRDDALLQQLEDGGLVALRYVDEESGEATTEFPHNPNGSVNGIAGICDTTGRVFGLMPHPEAYLSPFNHPHWTRQKINEVLPEKGLGLKIFENAVNFAAEHLL